MRPSKRDELVRKALMVFYKSGFNATGMDMLVSETGISKTSMYKHFRTKEELILAALRLRDELFRNKIYRRVDELGNTPALKLRALFDVLNEWFAEDDFKGCMFIKAAAEFQEPEHPIYRVAQEHKRTFLAYVTSLLVEAGADDAPGVARRLLLLKEGAIVAAHMGVFEQAAEDAKKAAELILVDAGV